jgi:hypothetical protein
VIVSEFKWPRQMGILYLLETLIGQIFLESEIYADETKYDELMRVIENFYYLGNWNAYLAAVTIEGTLFLMVENIKL